LGDYKDSAKMVKECQYQDAMTAFEAGDYSTALATFEKLGDYQEKCTECRCLLTAEKSARMHIVLDYNSEFVSMSAEEYSVDESGTYYTVKGRAFMGGLISWSDSGDDQGESARETDFQYYVDFTVVMVEDDESEPGFKVASWEAGDRRAVIDENADYVETLKNYIVKNGGYDKDGNRSYIEVKKGANLYYYLFAENEGISFWSFASYEGRYEGFSHSYKCFFDENGGATFETLVIECDMLNGKIDLTGDYTQIKAAGTIDYLSQDIDINDKSFIDINENDAIEYIADSHQDAITFIEEILMEAQIGVLVFEDLFKIAC